MRKKEIIDRGKKLNSRLLEINMDLNENNELFEPSVEELVEYPEKFFEVNDGDIDNFRKVKLEREKAAAAAKKAGSMMGGPKKKVEAPPEDTQAAG